MSTGGARGADEVGPREVEKRYGIPPELVPDFIALRGDPSDGIPGARGVGDKTAAELLREHGSLEGVLDAAIRMATLRDAGVKRPRNRRTDWVGAAKAAEAAGMSRLAKRLTELGG